MAEAGVGRRAVRRRGPAGEWRSRHARRRDLRRTVGTTQAGPARRHGHRPLRAARRRATDPVRPLRGRRTGRRGLHAVREMGRRTPGRGAGGHRVAGRRHRPSGGMPRLAGARGRGSERPGGASRRTPARPARRTDGGHCPTHQRGPSDRGPRARAGPLRRPRRAVGRLLPPNRAEGHRRTARRVGAREVPDHQPARADDRHRSALPPDRAAARRRRGRGPRSRTGSARARSGATRRIRAQPTSGEPPRAATAGAGSAVASALRRGPQSPGCRPAAGRGGADPRKRRAGNGERGRCAAAVDASADRPGCVEGVPGRVLGAVRDRHAGAGEGGRRPGGRARLPGRVPRQPHDRAATGALRA